MAAPWSGLSSRSPRYFLYARFGFEPRQQLRIYFVLYGAPVEVEPPRRLLLAAGFGVDQRAVTAQQLVGVQCPGQHLLGDPLPARNARCVRRPVLAADHHVPHALLQLADVARPSIAIAQVPVDPALGLLRQTCRLAIARHPPREEAHQGLPLTSLGVQLLCQ